MNRQRVAILGCGYVGSALAERLVRAGCDCVATTTTPGRVDEIRTLGATPAVIELSDADRLRSLLSDRDVVFLTVAPRDRQRYSEVYLDGADHVIRAIAGSSVRRIIYTSSTGVYGQDDGSWVDESSTTEPSSENGRVLVAAERCLIAGAEAAGIAAVVARVGGIYGPNRDSRDRVRALAGQEVTGGDTFLNLVHRDDVVSALVALAETKFVGLINVTGDQPPTRRAYYDGLITEMDLPPIRWVPDAPASRRGKRVRNDLIKRVLSFEFQS